eukprot:CAMPEP_0171117212 /NCGR_PEP_ID=MMETSP0766_2-20121228/91974_1 /TAXON_ID=439317 /ORGANISM="Gambierdiscus australes, Strain CAWD 149" /LENGTH=109 /DNA_ID=CAMNT_0011579711 /DNA_START=24 /DNA_END=350 /DNA_ORIENTATION=-
MKFCGGKHSDHDEAGVHARGDVKKPGWLAAQPRPSRLCRCQQDPICIDNVEQATVAVHEHGQQLRGARVRAPSDEALTSTAGADGAEGRLRALACRWQPRDCDATGAST